MKKTVQLAMACGLAAICSTGTALGTTSPAPVSSETQRNLDMLQTNRACPGCNLAGAELTRMKLAGADLEGANLSGARLLLADLAGANLRNANLSGANLGGADLAKADLSGADLSGAVLEGTFISQAQIQSATGYIPEKRLEIPDAELPVIGTAPSSPESDMRPAANAVADAAMLPQEDTEKSEAIAQDTATSKPLPISPAEVQVEQSRMTTEEPPPSVTESNATDSVAVEEVQQEAPADTLATAQSSIDTSLTEAKALPVAPGADGTTTQPDSKTTELVATESIAASPTPEPEASTESNPVVPPQEAVLSAEQAASAEEEAATTAQSVEPGASQEDVTLDSSRDQLLKQLFKQKQCIDCDLSHLDLSGRDLENFDLERANFATSNLSKADLRKANLKGADLRGAILQGADLRKADLYRADLRGADLRGARLNGALLDSASLDGSLGVPVDQVAAPQN